MTKELSGDAPSPENGLGTWRGVRFRPGFIVVRIVKDRLREPVDWDQPYALTRVGVTPLRVLWSLEMAEEEASRLNALNGAKGCHYCVAYVRVEGSAEGEDDADPNAEA